MAFDSNNYVAPSGGGYVAVVNGQKTSYNTQSEAENAYNAAQGSGGGGGGGTYQTQDGALTPAQMLAGLDSAAGGQWTGNRNDPAAIAAAYNAAPKGSGSYVNFDALGAGMQASIAAGTQAYNEERLRLIDQPMLEIQKDQLALQKANDAFNQKATEAGITGMWNNLPTMAKQQLDAQMTGMYNGAPTEMAREYNQNFGLSQAGVTGTYNGAPTEAAKEHQDQTALGYLNLLGGLRGPADYFQYLKVLNGTPNGITDLVNSATGRYQQSAFGGGSGGQPTPVGLNTMMGDVNGRDAMANPYGGALPPYQGPTYTDRAVPGTGVLYNGGTPNDPALRGQPMPSQPSYTDTPTGAYGFGSPSIPASMGGSMVAPTAPTSQPTYTDNPALSSGQIYNGGTPNDPALRGHPLGGGGQGVFDSGGGLLYNGGVPNNPALRGRPMPGFGVNTGVGSGLGQRSFEEGGTGGGFTAPQSAYDRATMATQGLPPPNQINAHNYFNMTPTQQSLLGAAYENQGYRPEDVQAMFKASLPKYAGPSIAKFSMAGAGGGIFGG